MMRRLFAAGRSRRSFGVPLPLGEVNAKRWVRVTAATTLRCESQLSASLTRAYRATSPRGRGEKPAGT